jgi:hypothetical protein
VTESSPERSGSRDSSSGGLRWKALDDSETRGWPTLWTLATELGSGTVAFDGSCAQSGRGLWGGELRRRWLSSSWRPRHAQERRREVEAGHADEKDMCGHVAHRR